MARGGIDVRIVVNEERILRALRDTRREIRQDMRAIMQDAADKHVVPRARAGAPSFARSSIVARSTTTGARLTTTLRGKQRAVVGLLEFGGTIRTPLRPKRARALRLRDGSFVMRVNAPRTIRAKRFMQGAVDERFRRFVAEVEAQFTERIERRVREARS